MQDPSLHKPGDRVFLAPGRKYVFGLANVLIPRKVAWLDSVFFKHAHGFSSGTEVYLNADESRKDFVAGVLALDYADPNSRRVKLLLRNGERVCPSNVTPTGFRAQDAQRPELESVFNRESDRLLARAASETASKPPTKLSSEPLSPTATTAQAVRQASAEEAGWKSRLRSRPAAAAPGKPPKTASADGAEADSQAAAEAPAVPEHGSKQRASKRKRSTSKKTAAKSPKAKSTPARRPKKKGKTVQSDAQKTGKAVKSESDSETKSEAAKTEAVPVPVVETESGHSEYVAAAAETREKLRQLEQRLAQTTASQVGTQLASSSLSQPSLPLLQQLSAVARPSLQQLQAPNTTTAVAQQLLQLQSVVYGSALTNLQLQLTTALCSNVLSALPAGPAANQMSALPAQVPPTLSALLVATEAQDSEDSQEGPAQCRKKLRV